MQPETWHVHICYNTGRVEPRQDVGQFHDVFRENTTRVTIFVQPLQSFVAY